MDIENKVVTLVFEDNIEVECPVIDLFEIAGISYIGLLHPENFQAMLYRFKEHEGGELELDPIESEEEFEKVSAVFTERNGEGEEE